MTVPAAHREKRYVVTCTPLHTFTSGKAPKMHNRKSSSGKKNPPTPAPAASKIVLIPLPCTKREGDNIC